MSRFTPEALNVVNSREVLTGGPSVDQDKSWMVATRRENAGVMRLLVSVNEERIYIQGYRYVLTRLIVVPDKNKRGLLL